MFNTFLFMRLDSYSFKYKESNEIIEYLNEYLLFKEVEIVLKNNDRKKSTNVIEDIKKNVNIETIKLKCHYNNTLFEILERAKKEIDIIEEKLSIDKSISKDDQIEFWRNKMNEARVLSKSYDYSSMLFFDKHIDIFLNDGKETKQDNSIYDILPTVIISEIQNCINIRRELFSEIENYCLMIYQKYLQQTQLKPLIEKKEFKHNYLFEFTEFLTHKEILQNDQWDDFCDAMAILLNSKNKNYIKSKSSYLKKTTNKFRNLTNELTLLTEEYKELKAEIRERKISKKNKKSDY